MVRSRVLSFLLDVTSVLVFVALGRRTHDAGSGVVGYLEVAAPFTLALVVAWLVVLLSKWDPRALLMGAVIAVLTWLLGLLLRATVFDGGTATAFVIVAGLFLFATMLGWRVVSLVRGRRKLTQNEAVNN
ncbi:MAG: DUF3054 domain-containing protein [Actinomycetia bacterium]|nr:DUF3054 domain-containing protein [Actinomycetes bacterium]MCH9801068.1 DUF3054 domain-containing protein [Actinomycetes bacterium]